MNQAYHIKVCIQASRGGEKKKTRNEENVAVFVLLPHTGAVLKGRCSRRRDKHGGSPEVAAIHALLFSIPRVTASCRRSGGRGFAVCSSPPFCVATWRICSPTQSRAFCCGVMSTPNDAKRRTTRGCTVSRWIPFLDFMSCVSLRGLSWWLSPSPPHHWPCESLIWCSQIAVCRIMALNVQTWSKGLKNGIRDGAIAE